MLRVLSGPLAGATFEVGPRLLIGRAAACDVHIVDVEVSREHAMIVSLDGAPTLVDLDSSNGTFVGGKRLRRARLRAGDLFSVVGSDFVYDRAAPISTTPVLSAHFTVESSAPSLPSEGGDGRPTRKVASVGTTKIPAIPMEDRQTHRAIASAKDEAPKQVSVSGATVQLEAATPESKASASSKTTKAESSETIAPESPEKATVQLRAMDAAAEEDLAASARATASLAAVRPPPEPESPEVPLSFAPPPIPTDRTVATRTRGKKKGNTEAYSGDLFADITAYRSFRLQLQLQDGSMPSGEEVASMIDLEAELREPVETDLRRDVVTKRFFRRFPFVTSLQARFTSSGTMVNGEGTTTNLSADGIRCSLELGDFSPKPEQLAMLVIEHTRDGVDVRYSVTARVVWSKNRVSGFVFAGVPSWSERGDEFDDVDTAIRAQFSTP